MFTTLQSPACTVMTRGQRNQKPYLGNSSNTTAPKGKEPVHTDSTKVAEPKIWKRTETKASTSAFDIVEFCKSSSITISPAEYLKLNPKELDKLVQYVKGSSTNNAQFPSDTSGGPNTCNEPVLVFE